MCACMCVRCIQFALILNDKGIGFDSFGRKQSPLMNAGMPRAAQPTSDGTEAPRTAPRPASNLQRLRVSRPSCEAVGAAAGLHHWLRRKPTACPYECRCCARHTARRGCSPPACPSAPARERLRTGQTGQTRIERVSTQDQTIRRIDCGNINVGDGQRCRDVAEGISVAALSTGQALDHGPDKGKSDPEEVRAIQSECFRVARTRQLTGCKASSKPVTAAAVTPPDGSTAAAVGAAVVVVADAP